jgi:hypothetical protein
MQLLPLLIAVILGASALAFVLYPLYRQSYVKVQAAQMQETPTQNGALHSDAQGIDSASIMNFADREHTARAILQEIELDYQLGNLGEADYSSLKERYMRRAILAMKSRQSYEQELDALIEEQLRRMKEGKVVEEHDEE